MLCIQRHICYSLRTILWILSIVHGPDDAICRRSSATVTWSRRIPIYWYCRIIVMNCTWTRVTDKHTYYSIPISYYNVRPIHNFIIIPFINYRRQSTPMEWELLTFKWYQLIGWPGLISRDHLIIQLIFPWWSPTVCDKIIVSSWSCARHNNINNHLLLIRITQLITTHLTVQ